MNIKELEKFLVEKNVPKYRIAQITQAVFKDGIISFQDISTLPKDLRTELEIKIKILSCKPEKIFLARDKSAAKVLLKAEDDCFFESVIMINRFGHRTACLSCMVGCPIGCSFCATGQHGFKRNLSSEEIIDQVLFWRNYLKANFPEDKLDSIVFMGMGEPFLNWENVKQSIKDLTNSDLFGYGGRSISISTIGIVEGIKQLAKDFPQVNLAVSLHSTNEQKRDDLVPVNQQYNLNKLRQAINQYIAVTNRKVFLEYILLAGVNDSKKDEQELIEYIQSFDKPYLLHVNLIPHNATSSKFKMTSKETAERFKNFLAKNKISITVRRSLGKEIEGACGQLAGKQLK